jgi:hypothetical protein
MTKDDISSWFHLTLLIPHDTNLYEYKHTLVLITDDEDPGTHYFKNFAGTAQRCVPLCSTVFSHQPKTLWKFSIRIFSSQCNLILKSYYTSEKENARIIFKNFIYT